MNAQPAIKDERYATLVKALLRNRKITYSRNSLWTNGKMLASCQKGKLIVKLPQERVDALVSAGEGKRYDPGKGLIQKEWFEVESADEKTRLALAREAIEFMRTKK